MGDFCPQHGGLAAKAHRPDAELVGFFGQAPFEGIQLRVRVVVVQLAVKHLFGAVITRAAVAADGDAQDARIRLARLEAKGGDLDKARERLRLMRDQSRKDAVMLFMVEAELLTEMDRKPEALKVYDAALEAHPDDPELLYARGLHGAAMQRLDVLEADLGRLLELDPDHVDALNALGYSLADMTDRHQEALALIQRALALKPDEGAILDSMGWVYYRLGNLELALDYLAGPDRSDSTPVWFLQVAFAAAVLAPPRACR